MPAPLAILRPASARGRLGFTLVELLVVMALIALVLVIAIPVFNSVSARLPGDADSLQGEIGYARLMAVSRGTPTEIRFYRHARENFPSDAEHFRSYQVLSLETSTDTSSGVTNRRFKPESAIKLLGESIVVNENAQYSSLAAPGRVRGPDPNANAVGNEKAAGYDYFAIRFLTDGSTALAKGDIWTLTLQRLIGDKATELPGDFITLQVDPFGGNVRRYEPGK